MQICNHHRVSRLWWDHYQFSVVRRYFEIVPAWTWWCLSLASVVSLSTYSIDVGIQLPCWIIASTWPLRAWPVHPNGSWENEDTLTAIHCKIYLSEWWCRTVWLPTGPFIRLVSVLSPDEIKCSVLSLPGMRLWKIIGYANSAFSVEEIIAFCAKMELIRLHFPRNKIVNET